MSGIEDLVRQMCPGGVPSKRLGDVGTFIRGNGMQKVDLFDSGFAAIHYGQIHTYYGTSATKTRSFVSPEFAGKLRKAEPGDLVIATTSEDDEAVGKAVAWLGDTPAAVSGDAYIYRHSLVPKYVSYFFQSRRFQEQKKRGITGTKVRRISGEALAKIELPVPPVEVQEAIVRVLDAFQSLEAQLQGELDARRVQYVYYRNSLLAAEAVSASPRSRLGDVATIRVGQVPPGGVVLKEGPYSFVNAGTSESGRAESFNTDGGTVTIPSRGQGGVGVVGYQAQAFWCGPLCYRIVSSSSELRTRFLYHYLKFIQPAIRGLRQTGGTPALNRKELILVEIPLPEPIEQDRIVGILDKLDTLVNSSSIGLPAELEARGKQYEYYRDRLLTFDEAVA